MKAWVICLLAFALAPGIALANQCHIEGSNFVCQHVDSDDFGTSFTGFEPAGPISIQLSNETVKGAYEALVTIGLDGKITYGPHYTPDKAAKAFWDAIGANAPCKVSK